MKTFFPCSCFSHPVLCLSLFCNLLAFATILLFFYLSSKFKYLICKGQCSPFSADMCCARAVCAKKHCSEFVLVIYEKKNVFKSSMGPGLGPQGKLEGLCVGSFNNCFGKFVPFFNWPGKKKLYLYILVLQTSIYKFRWVVISCLAFLLSDLIWNYYCQGAICDLVQVC